MKTALFYMSLLSLVLQLTLLPASAQLTLTVNSIADGGDSLPGDGVCDDGTGACTLRAAIEEANSTTGADTVAFDIPPGGVVHTIQPLTGLPTVTDTLLVDGYTQPGALPATVSNAAALMLVLDGALVSSNTDGVVIQADFSEVAGLVIQGFEDGIKLNGSDAVIRGNYIGTDVTGQADQGNSRGIFIDAGADRTRVGGQMPEDRNLISGNGSRGITILSASNTIQGNYIGTNVDGTAALGNGIGIRIQDVRTQIGGSSEGMRNLISGNTDNGIEMVANPITGPDMFTVIQGNYIGTDVTGTVALGNAQNGIEIAGAFPQSDWWT